MRQKLSDVDIRIRKLSKPYNMPFIEDEGKQRVAAHCLMLCTSFQQIEDEYLQQQSCQLNWVRFPQEWILPQPLTPHSPCKAFETAVCFG